MENTGLGNPCSKRQSDTEFEKDDLKKWKVFLPNPNTTSNSGNQSSQRQVTIEFEKDKSQTCNAPSDSGSQHSNLQHTSQHVDEKSDWWKVRLPTQKSQNVNVDAMKTGSNTNAPNGSGSQFSKRQLTPERNMNKPKRWHFSASFLAAQIEKSKAEAIQAMPSSNASSGEENQSSQCQQPTELSEEGVVPITNIPTDSEIQSCKDQQIPEHEDYISINLEWWEKEALRSNVADIDSSHSDNSGNFVTAENPLEAAIIDGSHLDGVMSLEKWSLVEAKILQVMMVKAENGDLAEDCDFEGNNWLNGVKTVTCENLKTLNFLKKTVSAIDELWPGAQLEVIPRAALPLRRVINVWIPPPAVGGGHENLILLAAQNKDLNAHKWKLLHSTKNLNGDGMDLKIMVDWNFEKAIKEKGGTLKFGLGTVRVTFPNLQQ